MMIFFLTLMLSITQSRKRLWAKDNTVYRRTVTIRALLLLAVIVIFLFFSLFR
ncbi:hypothetical protein ACLI1A_13530 [Flavobacterium sp. RHBU_3]|uniref:hypothetical protein n=1 Tax=Flavobacterium sp. RHBU_3 TaxID=3391184 RepID=UPI003984EEBA